jgi:YD repeat-containing protein
VSLDGQTALTDAAGAFLLSGVTAGEERPLMVDGRTASAPNTSFPLIVEPAKIVAGQANEVPYTFYLPPIDTQFEVEVIPGQETIATNARLAGLEMTIPAGANLRNRDGSPVTRASITPLAIDRTPAPLPESVRAALVFTSQPGGAITDIPIPVVYPNQLGSEPGTQMPLYAFDHDLVRWYIYGTGTVSADGRTIVPDLNPADPQGRRYGLRDFSWHFPAPPPRDNSGPCDCLSAYTSEPVDLSTGDKIETMTDVAFGGARGAVALTRYYSSLLMLRNYQGPFGLGTTHTYDIRVRGNFVAGGAGFVINYNEIGGRLFSYARSEGDGTLVFTTQATTAQLGDVVRKRPNGTFEYRSAQGGVMRFGTDGRLEALVDRNTNTVTIERDILRRISRIVDPVGRAIELYYDPASRIDLVRDPLGRQWRYSYTPSGQLESVTDPLQQTTRYSYNVRLRLETVTNRRGVVVKRISYDGADRVSRQEAG